jgi:sugar/nucleoside kinase (ribokinase family)
MPCFLIIGAVAWDRPIWLSAPLSAGNRIMGRTLQGELAGRLGGGAANAGLALVAAGHKVLVHTAIAADAEGDALMTEAQAAGLDLRLVRRTERGWRTTLLLIEPSGERIILGLDPKLAAGRQDFPALTADEVQSLAPDGLYLRAGAVPNAAGVMAACAGPCITHWPADAETLACAAILVGSRDDLAIPEGLGPFAAAKAQGAAALRWAILTDGPNPVCADNGETIITCLPPPATAVDATGAGDAFAAGLLEALAAGAPMEAALAHGCRWGAAAVAIDGSAPVGAGPDQFPPFS